MGLTCSVLGHRYGEREQIEEHDRQGSEEVIAMREVKTCDRCGDELVVSESKEVLAVRDEPDDPPEPESPAPLEPETPEPIEHAPPVDPEPSETDDGIILTDDEDREPGEWPPVEADEPAEKSEDVEWPDPEPAAAAAEPSAGASDAAWPDVEGEDEGFDAVTGDGDAEVASQMIEAAPDEPTHEVEETDAGFFRAGEIDSPDNPAEDNVHTEFYCPRCDWNAKSLTTSVRRGDICPSCRTGYIAERET